MPSVVKSTGAAAGILFVAGFVWVRRARSMIFDLGEAITR